MAQNHAGGQHPWTAMDDQELLKSAGLYGRDVVTGEEGFNLAALMLLGKDDVILNVAPTYVTDALVRKVNVDRYDDREIIKTNLIESYSQLLDFGRKNLPDKFFLEGAVNKSLRNTIVREMVSNIMKEYDTIGVQYNKNLKIGVMIETAAASVIADLLAREADFFSIGTNDLTQYTMSVDRGNADVAYLYSTFNPAVLRSIKHIIACAKEAGIPVGMCGEAAADKMMIPLLISFGLNEYSVSASSILSARKIISQWSKKDADALAEKIMKLKTEKEITEELSKAIGY